MTQDITDIYHFYASPLGQNVRAALNKKTSELLNAPSHRTILILGYGLPFFKDEKNNSGHTVFMASLSGMGGIYWPADSLNRTVLCEERFFPFADLFFDTVIVVHALEHADSPEGVMSEVWRVLKSSGKIFVITPNRGSIWSRNEKTPFAHGQPFSITQLTSMLKDRQFTIESTDRALYFPPVNYPVVDKTFNIIEYIGSKLRLPFGGCVMVTAVKRLYAVTPRKGTAVTWKIPVMKPGRISS